MLMMLTVTGYRLRHRICASRRAAKDDSRRIWSVTTWALSYKTFIGFIV